MANLGELYNHLIAEIEQHDDLTLSDAGIGNRHQVATFELGAVRKRVTITVDGANGTWEASTGPEGTIEIDDDYKVGPIASDGREIWETRRADAVGAAKKILRDSLSPLDLEV